MQNYFNYFTEIEERFQQRRGALLLLSTLDWALIETWREAGIPLDAVLRGIDAAFDKYDARQKKARMRKINGLAYCAQEVISAVEDMQEAAVGAAAAPTSPADRAANQGFEQERIAAHLEAAARQLRAAPQSGSLAEIGDRLQTLAGEVKAELPGLEGGPSLAVLKKKSCSPIAVLFDHTEDVFAGATATGRRRAHCCRSRMPAIQIRR